MNDLLAGAYRTLRVPEDASLAHIAEAYHLLVRDKDRNWDEIKDIERAFEILKDHLSSQVQEREAGQSRTEGPDSLPQKRSLKQAAKDSLLPSPEPMGRVNLAARAVFFLALLAWSVKFVLSPLSGDSMESSSFMHLVNLPFHEAGHIIFSFLGDFAGVLGGTVMQILVPLTVAVVFLRNSDPFGAAFGLWWTGQNLIDVSSYIYDARAGVLLLLGGVTGREAPDFHDWHNILSRLGLLSRDHAIAYFSKYAGALLLTLSLLWVTALLYRQLRVLRKTG